MAVPGVWAVWNDFPTVRHEGFYESNLGMDPGPLSEIAKYFRARMSPNCWDDVAFKAVCSAALGMSLLITICTEISTDIYVAWIRVPW